MAPAPFAGTVTSPVVVGVDTSPASATAVRAALRLAARLHRPLTVVHAVGLLEDGGYRPAMPVEELVETACRATGTGDQVTVTIVREDGPAADVLVRVARRTDAGLMVVGRRGLGSAPRPLGSVSEAVLARSDVPVLVVPDRSDHDHVVEDADDG